jgi:DNA-binding NarL/FixJ family response regulator
MAKKPTPWWEAVRLRREILESSGSIDDIQMSLFKAVYGMAGERPLYAAAKYYGDITHPSPNLTDLMAKVLVRLGGGMRYTAAPALWRLDQSMGGGKSHGLIGLWHLVAHPSEMLKTDIGISAFATATKIVGTQIAENLGDPQAVVLACDNMTVGKGDPVFDGPAQTLYERFLWRLFGGDNALYKRYKPHYGDKNKIAEALTAVGRPVLILVDEILDYIRALSLSENADLAIKDMAFLRALSDTVNDVPHVAMVVVMIASEHDTLTLDVVGQSRREEIDALLVRNGNTATVTSNTDFAAILRRRLFETRAPAEVMEATATTFLNSMKGSWSQRVFGVLPKTTTTDFEDGVTRCYPFHPALIALAEQEWAPMAGFQKVRSTISIFAATAYALSKRGQVGEWAPLLIGPGDLPLSSTEVREAVIGSGLIADERTQANYRQLASTDIVSDDEKGGSARVLDLTRKGVPFLASNPRCCERAASALFLYSVVGTRGQSRRGATEAELKAATFVPDDTYAVADAEAILSDLQDPEKGLAALERIEGRGGQAARLFLSTRQTLNMLFRAARSGVPDVDRDDEFAKAVERLANSGPFKEKKFVEALEDESRSSREILESAGIDDARSNRLVILDPRRFSFLNGLDEDTRRALRAAMGIGNEKLPVQWASSAVFAVVNTQRRKNARAAVANYVAWNRVCDIDAVRLDEELKQKAGDERTSARRAMDDAVKRAYQHTVFLDQGPDGEGRIEKAIRFDHDNQSALDGTIVWAKLVDEGKAFGPGEFNAKALLHNLLDSDYSRPLDELRDLFWKTPRMPLLPGGDGDLQRAIFEAVKAGSVRLIGNDDLERAVQRPSDIAVGSSSLHIAKTSQTESAMDQTNQSPTQMDGTAAGSADKDGDDLEPAEAEIQLGLTINTSLNDDARRNSVWKILNELATRVDDKDVSHIQLVVKAVLPFGKAEILIGQCRDVGASVNTTPIG